MTFNQYKALYIFNMVSIRCMVYKLTLPVHDSLDPKDFIIITLFETYFGERYLIHKFICYDLFFVVDIRTRLFNKYNDIKKQA